MKWKELLRSRGMRIGLCAVLILAILLGLCAPGIAVKPAYPDNPLQDVEVQEIDPLTIGENRSGQEQGDSEKTDSTEAENSSETEVDETTVPEDTNPPDMESENPDTEQNNEGDENPEDSYLPDMGSENSDTGQGAEGQEDGNQGEDGGEETNPDLAAVMTWYKYGTEPKTIVCGPSERVAKTLNTAQLLDNELKYEFFLTGEKAEDVKITSVFMQVGNGESTAISDSGTTRIELPDANTERDYVFTVNGHLKTRDSQGKLVEDDLVFTFVLHCGYAFDLELELQWEKKNDSTGTIVCAANETASKTIESNQLADSAFSYTPKLTGTFAENAEIVKAEYMTASGKSGELKTDGGTLILQTADNSEEERYYFTFEVLTKDADGNDKIVFYRFYILYVDTLDIQLSFTWLEKGVTKRVMICQPNASVSTDVKKNQLSAGAVKYEIALEGDDSENARILNLSYESEASGGGKLKESGSLPLDLPEGYLSNQYKINVIVLAGGEQFSFEIVLNYSMDISLEMSYTVTENGVQTSRSVLCENGKSETAEVIYDDQLKNGKLDYKLKFTGADAENLSISSVTCYQSGSGRIISLESSGEVELLLKNGKTGENTFTITGEAKDGTAYEFKISIPYKHRGENTVKITTNLTEGQVVTNEAKTNLSIRAWSEDSSGDVISYIPANGTDTKLIVMLDGEVLSYISSSGAASEYVLYPANPVKGDTNTHILSIYAEDSYGNYGELSINLKGQRNQAGQKKGTATIYIDMTALGMGVVDSVRYDVLADEPISYVVAKAVLGMDTGDPFGAATDSLGWKGRYSGTLDQGFYLQSLSPGQKANTLDGASWKQYGSNEEEILKAIDSRFGEGTGLATLWRCIYRNGLNKSSGSSGEYGEFDYTSGSGWLFSLDGTYYPGLSMSEYNLEDGDILTLRYTLAYGWDVGSGTPGYGNTVGYCVTAINGSYSINHKMEKVQNADGSSSYVCHCCGLVEGCAHENVINKDLGDGTHAKYCEDCGKTIGDPETHIWECSDEEHKCTSCGAAESHVWKEVVGSNTATCISAGKRTVSCTICKMTREEESPATGHSLNNRWNHTKTEHYQKCSVCGEVISESRGTHQYVYDANDDDWYCEICDAGHDWDYCGNDRLVIDSATCQKIQYHCSVCGLQFVREGLFEEYHDYVDGSCTCCGKADPDYKEPEPEPEESEESEESTEAPESEEPDPELLNDTGEEDNIP